jgi:hypothetical protein
MAKLSGHIWTSYHYHLLVSWSRKISWYIGGRFHRRCFFDNGGCHWLCLISNSNVSVKFRITIICFQICCVKNIKQSIPSGIWTGFMWSPIRQLVVQTADSIFCIFLWNFSSYSF